MSSTTIREKISLRQIILYQRASTEPQADNSYLDQLETIKSIYPEFSIPQSTIVEISEVMSGLADAEIRMVTGLGKALEQLELHPDAILLVSNANRLARRADVFELIQLTGLGHRIYDATTGLCLNDVIKLGSHIAIEKQIKAQLAKVAKAIARLMRDGGSMGYDGIAHHSAEGSEKKKRLAQERKAQVFSVISQLTIQARGKTPTHKEICSELSYHGVHTGQRRPFTPNRLAHLKKSDCEGWDYAFDSYHRPRRNIRASVTAAQTNHVKRRNHKRHLRLFLSVMTHRPTLLVRANPRAYCRQTSLHHRPRKTYSMTGCHDGCRGPPDTSCTACALQRQS
ncbi:hypothetical protein [Algirhabdus cladophorae]|uniref:hypothetical protein n=1 Tax=Algirhabdus cladophorae TaxID=3377108 RepID=UPI003B845CE1